MTVASSSADLRVCGGPRQTFTGGLSNQLCITTHSRQHPPPLERSKATKCKIRSSILRRAMHGAALRGFPDMSLQSIKGCFMLSLLWTFLIPSLGAPFWSGPQAVACLACPQAVALASSNWSIHPFFFHQGMPISAGLLLHGCIIRTGYSVGGGVSFFPMRAAHWTKWHEDKTAELLRQRNVTDYPSCLAVRAE